MAPAITLKRMYHWVPSSISAMEPMPSPPPILTSAMSRTGKSAVAGTEAAICASGWAMRARRGMKPMATPTGMVQSAARSSEALTRRKVAPAPLSSSTNLGAVQLPQQQHGLEGGKDGGDAEARRRCCCGAMSER